MKPIYLVITSYFPTPEEPWRCSFIYDQVRAIQRATDKYDVVVLRPDREGEYEFRGVRVIGFRYLMSGGWIWPWAFGVINVGKMMRTLAKAGISPADIAVVHGHLVPMAAYVNALKKCNPAIKALLQFHDADPYGMMFGQGRFRLFKRRRYFAYHRKLVIRMDALVSISENVSKVIREAPHQTVFNTYAPMREAMTDLASFQPLQRLPRIILLHNGVNTQYFFSQSKEREEGFVIGCVAVFRDIKDQMSLLRAVSLIKDRFPLIKVKLVGVHHSGTMLDDCKRFIAERNLPVEIIPSIDHEDLPDFYRSLDLFVLPSYYEGFGCVYTEAWSCGTPFIACEGQGIEDMVRPEDRPLWLCKQQDPVDLANKISYYFEHNTSQKLAGEVDIDKIVREFVKEIEAL